MIPMALSSGVGSTTSSTRLSSLITLITLMITMITLTILITLTDDYPGHDDDYQHYPDNKVWGPISCTGALP